MNNYLEKIKSQRQEELKDKEEARLHQAHISAIEKSTDSLIKATLSNEPKVTVKNTDLAKTQDILSVKNAVVDQTTQTMLSVSTLKGIKELVEGLLSASKKPTPETKIELHQEEVISALKQLSDTITSQETTVKVEQDRETAKQLKEIKQLFKTIDFTPKVTVPKSSIKVESSKVDVQPIVDTIAELKDSLIVNVPEVDMNGVVEGLDRLQEGIKELISKPFPVQEYPTTITTKEQTLAVRLDDTTTADTTYIGKAEIGSPTSSAVWQISKLATSSGLIKTWSGNGAFNQVWDDRVSLSYI